MFVRKVSFRNFRNITETTLSGLQGDEVYWLHGKNGAGKTSVLEGIFVGTNFRSFRDHQFAPLVQKNSSFSEVHLDLQGAVWHPSVKIAIQSDGKKAAFIDQKPIHTGTQFLKARMAGVEEGFHSILFHPTDHELIRGEPSLRRKYLDQVISAVEPDYLKKWIQYRKLLEHRNSILKTFDPALKQILREFEDQWIELGSELTLSRALYLERAEKPFKQYLKIIWNGKIREEEIFLKYQPLLLDGKDLPEGYFSGQNRQDSLDFIRSRYREKIGLLGDKERRLGVSLVGPHRDDWMVYFVDAPLDERGSQGEIRSCLLALKMAEVFLFQEWTKFKPVLLIDDFSSELDSERRISLMNFLKESRLQVFVTSTEIDISGNAKSIEVNHGSLLVKDVA